MPIIGRKNCKTEAHYKSTVKPSLYEAGKSVLTISWTNSPLVSPSHFI